MAATQTCIVIFLLIALSTISFHLLTSWIEKNKYKTYEDWLSDYQR